MRNYPGSGLWSVNEGLKALFILAKFPRETDAMSKKYRQSNLLRHFSTLAGPLRKPSSMTGGAVQYSEILPGDHWLYQNWTKALAYGTFALVCVLAFMLFQPSHWIVAEQAALPTRIASWLVLVSLSLLQILLLIGTFSATRATLKARNPLPVRAPKGFHVAFATTRAPGEPVEMVRKTLLAITKVHYPGGKVDAWLLDETNSPELAKLCRELGANYFSRNGVAEWNTERPKHQLLHLRRAKTHFNPVFAHKTKHGNLNAWGEYLTQHKSWYDFIAGVDTDHVPEPNFLERTLGYFRDADVAFVVGPQVYGNYGPGLKQLVPRWSESQSSFFQSTTQRAGNATASPMFIGTNYVVRTSALDQIGGFQPCITEDMATGLAIHSLRNPRTGRRWKSVYTPDVLAIGEGPTAWGPYFSQQWRWAAGSFDTWKRIVWRKFFKLERGVRLHYFLMLMCYPSAALTWLFGIVNSIAYLMFGAGAVELPWNQFIALYLMSLTMQMSLYFWSRRYNVSPFEPVGSYGLAGTLISMLSAPVYFDAFVGILFGKKPHFVVTRKGEEAGHDNLQAFHIHLKWAAVLVGGLIVGVSRGHTHPAMMTWVALQLVVCLLPVALGMALPLRAQLRKYSKRLLRQRMIGEQNA